MKTKKEIIQKFVRMPLKHSMSRFLLQFLLDEPDILDRVMFVRNRDFLPDTMLISELGSPRVGFELELGAYQREEVALVNGNLIKYTKRDRSKCISEPMKAIHALREFTGKLYVVFSFAGPCPSWYEEIVVPNPLIGEMEKSNSKGKSVVDTIIREQIELALFAILLRERIEESLKNRDFLTFRRLAPIYNRVIEESCWEFE